jgi:NADPH:quinone reductase-like Zn-dependent oxidoreductase
MSYRKVVISKFGPPDVLKIIEEEYLPEPKSGEVRIKVLVTSASFTDTLLRKGIYPEVRKKVPFPPGYDLVGIVDKCGGEASKFPIGKRVTALTVYGAYSEYLCVNEDELIEVPEGLDSSEVVCLILSYMTAYQMLYRIAKVVKGQSILIHGAGGAVGTALLQLGKLFDLKMYGTGSKSKKSLIEKLGAVPIDYQSEDFVERIKTENNNVDAVFDCIGGDYFQRSFSILKVGGILVAYGFQKAVLKNAGILEFALGFIKLKLLNLSPNKKTVLFYSITTIKKKHPEWFKEDLTTLIKLLKEGQIKPIISHKMPLIEAVEAHKMLDQSKVEGKIVLIVNEEI